MRATDRSLAFAVGIIAMACLPPAPADAERAVLLR